MQKRSARCGRLPAQHRKRLDRIAEVHRESAALRIAAQRDRAIAQLALYGSEKAAADAVPKPMALSRCRLTAAALQSLQRLYASAAFGGPRAETLRRISCVAPKPPTQEVRRLLKAQKVFKDNVLEQPWRAPHVCQHRDSFEDTALITTSGDASLVCKFVYACQAPEYVAPQPAC